MKNNLITDNMDNKIVSFIESKRSEDRIKEKFPNTLLRKDVLALLDLDCTVVYYPLKNETINGFHVGLPNRFGDEIHFVYINTAQTLDKQIFTAAHELGHAWRVDEYVAAQCGEQFDSDAREEIINRFAAELLMPKEQFISAFNSEFHKYENEDGQLSVVNVVRIVAGLMMHFYVPRKAVVYRLFELGRINDGAARLLLGEKELTEAEIDKYISFLMQENGYTYFIRAMEEKRIDGLPDLLDKAEANGTVTEEKIANLRFLFDLPKKDIANDEMGKMVDVIPKDGEK